MQDIGVGGQSMVLSLKTWENGATGYWGNERRGQDQAGRTRSPLGTHPV